MAIQNLKIRGYRSLKDVSWQPGPLNLLVGPNGSGKSTLIRCLELISRVARGELDLTLSREGGVIPILWDHQKGTACEWSLTLDSLDVGNDLTLEALTYNFKLAQLGMGSGYEIVIDSLSNPSNLDTEEELPPFWIFKRDSKQAEIYDHEQEELVALEEESSDSLDGYNENESLLSQNMDFHTRIPKLTQRAIESWNIHHDIHVERGSAMRQPTTTQYTKKLAPDGSNLVTVLHTLYTGNREFKERINEGMEAGFGDEYKELVFQPASAQQIQLAIQWNSSSQPHVGSDLSDGTLRFLFLLTVLSHPEPASLIAIDEPELGLHPSMLPILAEYASDASTRTQVVISSHSPEFLDAFTDLDPHVTLCQLEAGQTFLHTLDSDMLGRWLEKYRLGQMFTQGELELLAMDPVDQIEDIENRFEGFPSDNGPFDNGTATGSEENANG